GRSRASESAPPETATAPGHSPPCPRTTPIESANSACEIASAATGGFAGVERLIGDGFRSGRVLVRKRAKGSAAFLFLIHCEQRLAEFQHAVGRALTFGIFFQLLGERARRRRKVLLHERNIADPIDGLWGQL